MLTPVNIHGVMFHKIDCIDSKCPMREKANWTGCIYYNKLTKQTVSTCSKVTWADKTEAAEFLKKKEKPCEEEEPKAQPDP
jgi:hypothetical protein